MIIRNSLKLLLDNFSNVWKILLYKAIIFIISLGFVVGLVLPNAITIINSIADTGLFENISKIANDFFARGIDITSDLEAFKTSLENSSLVLTANANRLMLSYIFIIIIIVFTNLLTGLSDLVVSDIINADMSANAKYNFSSRFIITFGTNIKYQLVRLVTEIPVYIITAYAVWNIFSFLFSYIAVFSLFFAFVALIILLSASQSFFCCWLPEITVKGTKRFDAIRIGFNIVRPHFSVTFSSFILIYISLFFVNIVLAFFTCGAGLLLSLPMSALFLIIFRLVTYYERTGSKYYTDSNTVVIPKSNKDIN